MNQMMYVHTAINPDLDGIACAVGYAFYLSRTGFEAVPCIHGNPDGEARFHLRRLEGIPWVSEDDVPQLHHAIIVDFSWLGGLSLKVDPACVAEIIDHHVFDNSGKDFPNAKMDIQEVGAAATLVVERIRGVELQIPQVIAEALYGAIYSNTQSLKGAITTPRDITSACWLAEKYNLTNNIISSQYAARTQSIAENLSVAISAERNINSYLDDPVAKYGVTQFEVLDARKFWLEFKVGILEGLNQLAEPSILNLIDALEGYSIVYINDRLLTERFINKFDVREKFCDDCFFVSPAILRKIIFRLI